MLFQRVSKPKYNVPIILTVTEGTASHLSFRFSLFHTLIQLKHSVTWPSKIYPQFFILVEWSYLETFITSSLNQGTTLHNSLYCSCFEVSESLIWLCHSSVSTPSMTSFSLQQKIQSPGHSVSNLKFSYTYHWLVTFLYYNEVTFLYYNEAYFFITLRLEGYFQFCLENCSSSLKLNSNILPSRKCFMSQTQTLLCSPLHFQLGVYIEAFFP